MCVCYEAAGFSLTAGISSLKRTGRTRRFAKSGRVAKYIAAHNQCSSSITYTALTAGKVRWMNTGVVCCSECCLLCHLSIPIVFIVIFFFSSIFVQGVCVILHVCVLGVFVCDVVGHGIAGKA